MKKLFKLIRILRGAAQTAGRGRAQRHAYYPLAQRPSFGKRLLRRLTSGVGR